MIHLEEMIRESRILTGLGITANYKGFYQTAYALKLLEEDPERLQYVTKWLYPDVAKAFKTNANCIERNIRTMCGVLWKRNPGLMSDLAGYDLEKAPCNVEFLAILLTRIVENE